MELMIVTGVSGAGKTVALKTFEDMGYYCVDNLPVFLIPQFADLGTKNGEITHFAIGVDSRSGTEFGHLSEILHLFDEKNIRYRILFLEAKDEVLIKRYKETRRSHPLARTGRIEDGIRLEREALEWLKEKADVVIDTSNLRKQELTAQLKKIFSDSSAKFRNMVISLMSFGYKFGIPADADLVFDVRFLPNPFYVEELRNKNGLSEDVYDYCISSKETEEFLHMLYPLIEYLIPKYIEEGKNQLVIAFGCTGGKHRSVSIAEEMKNRLGRNEQLIITATHRDIYR